MTMLSAYLVPHPPLLIPGVGSGRELPDTRNSYIKIADELKLESPDTVVLISPHSVLYDDYIHISPGTEASGSFAAFGAGNIKISVSYDTELASEISETALRQGIPAGGLGEKSPSLDHGVMVPLYFIKPPRIVRISLSGFSLIDHYRFGMCIQNAALKLNRHIAVVASGDMSHRLKEDGPYGFAPEGPEHDKFVCDCVGVPDFIKLMSIDPVFCERAAECGLRSVVMLAGALDGMNVQSRVLCYEGPFGVGYLTAAFEGQGQAPSLLPKILEEARVKSDKRRNEEDAFVRLARNNIEHFVKTGKNLSLPSGLPEEMLKNQAGVFVSIKKDGRLRGCIGTIAPMCKNIAEEIIKNSVSAAKNDPRFDPVKESELSSLSYSVDVLSPPEPIDSPDMLDVCRYGVIVTNGFRRGLLLPNLEGVDTVRRQIDIALDKAGIRSGEPYKLERFEVVRHL